jgi:ABC-2 type transport system ATP-binding protein
VTCGLDPLRERRRLSSKVGYFSQKFSLYGDLTIDQNIAFFAEIHGVSNYRDRRDRLLEMMQLTAFRGRLAERLSGGMKQKLALACTLVHEPEIILLDEPTTGVDPVSRREFWRLLSEFLSQGITIFMATPYLDEAERCSRVALMSQGRILALDEPNALRAAFPDDLLEMLAEPQDAAVRIAARDPGVHDVQRFGERLHIRVVRGGADAAAARLAAACRLAGVRVGSLRAVPASLEDVFIDRVVTTREPSAV